MRLLILAILSAMAMNANAHSILPPPSESVESIPLAFEMTYDDFILANKVEKNNLNCAEDAWAFGSWYSAAFESYYGFAPPSNEVYMATNAYYNDCVNPGGMTTGMSGISIQNALLTPDWF